MSSRSELESRRAVLIARCERQRYEASIAWHGIGRALRPIDAAATLGRRVAARPALAIGVAVVVVLVIRPRHVLRFLVWGASTAVAVQRFASVGRKLSTSLTRTSSR